MTRAGKRLLQVMSTVPPQGRLGLLWFIEAIEVEARNLGYADRLEAHIEGLCGETRTYDATGDGGCIRPDSLAGTDLDPDRERLP